MKLNIHYENKKIEIENFRLLKNFSMDLEKELSLVIGKNNAGKTFILTILDKFLNQSDKNRFIVEDFNLNFKQEIHNLLKNEELSEEDFKQNFYGIKLRLLIEYGNEDNFKNIQKLMLDLDPENKFIVFGFDYLNYL